MAMRRGTTLMVAMVAGCLGAWDAQAQAPEDPVHDATLEFSLHSNPNGVWSYRTEGFKGVRLMKVTNQAFRNVAGLSAWTNGKQDLKRAYVASNTTKDAVRVGNVTYLKGELVLKTDDTGSVFIDFKAPEPGLYRVSGFFRAVDKKEESHVVQVAGRKTVYFRANIVEYGERAPFHFFLSMKKSDILEFASASPSSQQPQRSATSLNLLVKGPITK